MSDHNREIVVGKTDGSASSDNTNPWDDLSDQFNKGGGSAPVDADLDRVSESMEKAWSIRQSGTSCSSSSGEA